MGKEVFLIQKIVDAGKHLCDVTHILTTMENKMTTENRNEYVDQAIIDDYHNDLMVTMTLRSCIHDALKVAMKFQNEGAMAYNGELLTDVIAKLDDILAEQIAPVDQKIEEGISFHEANTNAA